MSTLTAPVVKIEKKPHPNADSLSIAIIGKEELCFQCVIKTEEFLNEDYAVHIPIDVQTSADHSLLGFLDGKPVKPIKLRGEFSNGILIPLSKVRQHFIEDLKMKESSLNNLIQEGKNLAGPLRLKRYYPHGKLSNGGGAEDPDPYFQKYTEVEHLNKYQHIIQIGEDVEITEKLHGTSARFALIEQKFVLGSRKLQLKLDIPENKYSVWHSVFFKENLQDKLKELQDILGSKVVGIYGEIVGPKVQDLHYEQSTQTLFVYDILKAPNRFLDHYEFIEVTKQLNLKTVPLLKVGEFVPEDLSLRRGQSLLANHYREGIVIKPVINRHDPEVGRVVLKVISEDYLLRDGAKDIKNV